MSAGQLTTSPERPARSRPASWAGTTSRRRALRPPTGRRANATRYGSELLQRATAVGRIADVPGTGLRVLCQRLRLGLPVLLLYYLCVPRLTVPTSTSPVGQLVRDQVRARWAGRTRYRKAQGVLFLPETFAEYLRGRKRQAVRTNLRRAREAGLSAECRVISDWKVERRDPRYVSGRPALRVESWKVRDADGEIVADAVLAVDDRVAVLQFASSTAT